MLCLRKKKKECAYFCRFLRGRCESNHIQRLVGIERRNTMIRTSLSLPRIEYRDAFVIHILYHYELPLVRSLRRCKIAARSHWRDLPRFSFFSKRGKPHCTCFAVTIEVKIYSWSFKTATRSRILFSALSLLNQMRLEMSASSSCRTEVSQMNFKSNAYHRMLEHF